ncbi:MAG: tRNA lysidine(34) synthetase TilS [Silicimonas sp.]|nr:tRNA lysidine(34) synthetase TilS [Silicimonas sp.]
MIQFAERLDAPREALVGVAVSGGSDSVAALHLLADAGWNLHVVTVDHRLRDGSAAEAGFVGRIADDLGLPHSVLTWDHDGVQGNLQDQARRARYGLIRDWAASQGIRHVVLGHTMDDQAETVLMRIARGAGLDGLCGMASQREDAGVTWLRPFLTARREDLRAYLAARSAEWIDDPSNEDTRFDRVKARQAMAALAPLGIDAERLSAMSARLQDVRSDLDLRAREAFLAAGEEDRGDLVLHFPDFRKAAGGPEVLRRTFVAALRWVSGAEYPPRAEALSDLIGALRSGETRTLSGCVVTAERSVRFSREFNAVKDLHGATDLPWDGRWVLEGPHAPDLDVRALGDAVKDCAGWRETGMPRTSLLASPAVWRGDALIAAPVAGLTNGWRASATRRGSFTEFLLSR